MLTGRVSSEKEAVIPIEVLSSLGRATVVDVTLDTGFDGYLTLPKSLIRDLHLPYVGAERAALGDGSEIMMDVFLAEVKWGEENRPVLVLGAEGGCLLGMTLLEGCRVTIDVEKNGIVSIEPLAMIRAVN